MATLTPASRRDETVNSATFEGLVNGAITLIPTLGGLAIAMKNPTFVARTNWQSRTAMVIMPPLFMFGLTAETKLNEHMHNMARENRHSRETVHWAEEEMKRQRQDFNDSLPRDENLHLNMLYQRSVKDSGVCVVPGDRLAWYHQAANYAAENPVKVLAATAIPAVSAIFWGGTGKEHLEFSVRLLHTRVFGQFATISLLMGVIGFKEFMDRNGRFITEADAAARVEEMHAVRAALMSRLEAERQILESQQRRIKEAHDEDVKDRKVKEERKRNSHESHQIAHA